MRFHVLVTDFDGTLAWDGSVAPHVLDAIGRFRASGRRVVLATGRTVDDLKALLPDLTIFDAVVAENGAVLLDPGSGAIHALAPAPPPAFVADAQRRGVTPLEMGAVIVATRTPNEATMVELIRDHGLDLTVTFNKGAVMILPAGTNKATGISRQLAAWHLSWHNVAGIGDAENDLVFLERCEASAAVANALPSVAPRCDLTTAATHGDGVVEFIDRILANELDSVASIAEHHAIVIGRRHDGELYTVPAPVGDLLLAGQSGGGKTRLLGGIAERAAAAEYQFCIVDPEGDYSDLRDTIALGDAKREPTLEALNDAIANGENVVFSMLAIKREDRAELAQRVFARIHELRARYGRPHWLFLDEAHHLLPAESPLHVLDEDAPTTLYVTTQPHLLARQTLQRVGIVLAIGSDPRSTIGEVATASGTAIPPDLAPDPVPKGTVLLWRRDDPTHVLALEIVAGFAEHRRHLRKYAEGDLADEKSFFFTGADHKLNLRANNLLVFVQMAEGIDDETWSHHLRQGDYSRWIRESIGDQDLGAVVAEAEREDGAPRDSRARIIAAIRERYTAPA